MEVLEAIKNLRAVRRYSSKEVSNEVIANILDAGRQSQSSRNSQPWRFLVVREKETLKKLSQMGKFASHLAQASFGIAIVTPNPDENVSILFDAGQAAVYMQLSALDYGVGSCIVKLHEGHLAKSILELPDDYELNFVISFGYPANYEMLNSGKKTRKLLSEISYLEKWGLHFR